MKKIKVLMVGPSRDTKGGMTTVVDNYFNFGLNNCVDLEYIESCRDGNYIAKLFKEIVGFLKYLILVFRFDIVHLHLASRRSTFRKIVYIKVAHFLRKKIVIHIHGGGFKEFFDTELNHRKQKYVKKWLNKANSIIVLSEEWEEYFKEILENDRVTVIYNAVLVPENFDKSFNYNILFLGRICKEKGIFDLLKVYKSIQKKYSEVCLNICGSGNENLINEYIKKEKIDNVILHGWIKDDKLINQLKCNSVFILPSYYEGLPMSILEAMAYKNIVISTNVGGIPKVIEDGVDGFIFEPGDCKRLEMIILNILENKKIQNEIPNKARNKIKNRFDIKNNIEKTFDIYKKIMFGD